MSEACKMLKFSLVFVILFVCLVSIYAKDGEDAAEVSSTPGAVDVFQEPDAQEVIECIEKFEQQANIAAKAESESDLPLDDTETVHEEMIIALEDIIELMNANRNNAYVFLKSKGVDRVLVPNLSIYDIEVKTRLLVLMKTLFNVTPTTTQAMTPVFVVDKLLDIFENDNHVPLKAHTLDVLCLWLPGNPRVQARVMKVKGLAPFYHQLSKLDASVVHSLLDLFSKILNEHLKVRNDNSQRSRADAEKLKIYQRIGLIEIMSTPMVCNGLLNVFETAWSYSLNNNDIIIPVFNLLKTVKPFCMKNISRNMIGRAIELFQNFSKHIKDLKDKDVKVDGFDSTEIESVLQDYIDTLKRVIVKEDL